MISGVTQVYPQYQVDGLQGDHLLNHQRQYLLDELNHKMPMIMVEFHCLGFQVSAVIKDENGNQLGYVDQAGRFRSK